MFNAKVYRVRIASAGTILEEERLARDIINRWSLVYGEQKGAVFLPISIGSDSLNPDLFIFVADAYVDERLVDAALTTGVPVVLFCRKYHDTSNSIPNEIKEIEVYRRKIGSRSKWFEYVGKEEFERLLIYSIEAIG